MAGRPRLSTPERRRNILASKARWREANRDYYREQKRLLTNRPEYKERRKELREQKRAPDPEKPSQDETSLWAWYQANVHNAPSGPVDACVLECTLGAVLGPKRPEAEKALFCYAARPPPERLWTPIGAPSIADY